MAKMKATVRNGRTNKSGRVYNANHNTRKETRNLEGHIDHERTAKNVNFKFLSDGSIEKSGSFDSKTFELSQYEVYFGEGQKAKNDRYIKDGHPERCKTVAEVYSHPKTAPLETIIQLGNRNTDISPAERKRVMISSAFELIDSLRAKYGNNVKILSLSIHNDENTLHGHLRICFVGKDKFGFAVPNQSQAFKEMGIERPDVTKKEGKYNNPLITFSSELREKFYSLCEQKGIEIDREVKAPSQKHRDILEYKCNQLEKSVTELTAERNTLRNQNSIAKVIQSGFNKPQIEIKAEPIKDKANKGAAESVKISKSEFEWLKERARLTIGIKTAFESLQRYGKELWDKVNQEKYISELNSKLENEERQNREQSIQISKLSQNLNLAYEQLQDQQEFMQETGLWKRFCDFIKEKFRERQETEYNRSL